MIKLKTVFMGTPEFSVPCLKKLIDISTVVAVVTQPDKRQGRGQHIVFSPVKECALANGLKVFQPDKIKNDEDFMTVLEELKPDLIVVVAFGQILPKRVLNIPKYGCINVHASLLPSYRGAAPMQWAILNGEKKTGVTTMRMDVGLDTGDMLLSSEIAILPDMTLEELHDKMMIDGANLLVRTIGALCDNKLIPKKQNDELSSYAPMITKETGRIDWKKSAIEIHNLVRGLDSWPGAYCMIADKVFKIWKTRVVIVESYGKAGEVLEETKDGLLIGTGNGGIEILEIQAPGKKRMKVKDYLRGNKIEIHTFFT